MPSARSLSAIFGGAAGYGAGGVVVAKAERDEARQAVLLLGCFSSAMNARARSTSL